MKVEDLNMQSIGKGTRASNAQKLAALEEMKREESSESDGEGEKPISNILKSAVASKITKKEPTRPLREITPESIFEKNPTRVGDNTRPSNKLCFAPTKDELFSMGCAKLFERKLTHILHSTDSFVTQLTFQFSDGSVAPAFKSYFGNVPASCTKIYNQELIRKIRFGLFEQEMGGMVLA